MLRYILHFSILLLLFQECGAQHISFVLYSENGKNGLMRENKTIIIPALYDNALNPESLVKFNLLHVAKNGKHGFIDSLNQIVLPIVYDDLLFPVNENKPTYHACRIGNKWGMIDPKGKAIIPVNFEYIEDRPDLFGNFQVWSRGYFGLYSNTGKEILPAICHEIDYFSMPMFWYLVKTDKGTGIIDKEGKVIVAFVNEDIHRISKKGKKMLIERSGEIITIKNDTILTFHNTSLYSFPENPQISYCIQTENSGKTKVYYAQKIDGTLIENTRSEGILYPGEFGMFVARNSKWYFLPIEPGTIKRESIAYDEVTAFGDGLFKVRKNERFGLLNDKGEIVQPIIYHNLYRNSLLRLEACKNSTAFIIGRMSAIREKPSLVLINPVGKRIAQHIERIRFLKDENSEFKIGDNYFSCDGFGNFTFIPSIYSLKISRQYDFIKRLVYRDIHSSFNRYILGKNQRYDLYTEKIDTSHIPRFDTILPVYYRPSFLFYPIDNPEYFIVRNKGKYGLLDQYGKLVFPCEYLQIIANNTYVYGSKNIIFSEKDTELQHVLLRTEKGWSIGNTGGKIITNYFYEDFKTDEYVPSMCLKRNGTWFIISVTGEEIPMAPIKNNIPCYDCNRIDVWDL